jgi:hypothetical protein
MRTGISRVFRAVHIKRCMQIYKFQENLRCRGNSLSIMITLRFTDQGSILQRDGDVFATTFTLFMRHLFIELALPCRNGNRA